MPGLGAPPPRALGAPNMMQPVMSAPGGSMAPPRAINPPLPGMHEQCFLFLHEIIIFLDTLIQKYIFLDNENQYFWG